LIILRPSFHASLGSARETRQITPRRHARAT